MMSSHSKPKVTLSQGTVIGLKGRLPNGRDYYSFKGIPYAAPPIGKLRFEPPVILKSFSHNILDCTKERNVSFQRDLITNEPIGSEDCLFLNVYTPNRTNSLNSISVMVYIHGGSFSLGSGNSDMYNPLYLLEEDVVVVTINYRLGILGFLSYPEGGLAGNCGLKDQVLALKWVQENISYFNGDPNNITLFGESAGSICANLHVISDKSKKLFHKAILQSGTFNMQWSFQRNPSYKAEVIAKHLGFQNNDPKAMVAFLKDPKNSPEKMIPCEPKTLTPDERRRDLYVTFGPVIEASSTNAIITENPLLTILVKNEIDIPIMMGYNSNEGIISLVTAVKRLHEYDADMAKLIPRALNINIDGEEGELVGKEIRKFYFKGRKVDNTTLQELSNALSDYHFVFDAIKYAEIHARHQHNSPLYFYRFDYEGDLDFYKKVFNFQNLKGVCHADELFYIFQTESQNLPHKENSPDTKMVKRICRLWTNFAKYSDPTPSVDDGLLSFKWSPVAKVYDQEKEFVLDYLNITNELKMEQQPERERMEFWKNIFKKWNIDYLRSKL